MKQEYAVQLEWGGLETMYELARQHDAVTRYFVHGSLQYFVAFDTQEHAEQFRSALNAHYDTCRAPLHERLRAERGGSLTAPEIKNYDSVPHGWLRGNLDLPQGKDPAYQNMGVCDYRKSTWWYCPGVVSQEYPTFGEAYAGLDAATEGSIIHGQGLTTSFDHACKCAGVTTITAETDDPFSGYEPDDSGLRAALSLEVIGDDTLALLRQTQQTAGMVSGPVAASFFAPGRDASPWAARLNGVTIGGKFRREFLRGQKDYSRANSIGSRGVYLHYSLPPGVYQVHEKTAWQNFRTYFLLSQAGRTQEITRQEAVVWLKNKD